MEARLKQAREARTPNDVTVSITITDERVRDFSGAVRLVSNGTFVLQGKEGEALSLGAGSKDDVGQLIGWLLMSSDPVDGLGKRGDFEPKKSAVEVIDDTFGYRYGSEPAIVVTRSLDRVLEMRWRQDGAVWVARFEHGEDAWPRVLSITRSGRPFIRMEVDPGS